LTGIDSPKKIPGLREAPDMKQEEKRVETQDGERDENCRMPKTISTEKPTAKEKKNFKKRQRPRYANNVHYHEIPKKKNGISLSQKKKVNAQRRGGRRTTLLPKEREGMKRKKKKTTCGLSARSHRRGGGKQRTDAHDLRTASTWKSKWGKQFWRCGCGGGKKTQKG